jgi:UDP-GlcNAc:undecaprenyl-phosphate GlcNAc-1-phosphate transferase
MINLIIIYSILSLLLLFFSGKISYHIGLVDVPIKRKLHSKATVYTGGITISFILVLSILLLETYNNYFNIILSIAFLISIIGLIDDKFNLNVGGKLSLQIIPIFYLIVFENLIIHQLGDYVYFKLELGAFKLPFTLICILFLINSFNYFDGLDGTLSFSSITVLAILYFLNPDQSFRFYLITILIPLSIFLCFNFSIFKLPKMFLGDSGSLMLGFVISFILIYLANYTLIHPILLAWTVSIFVYEFLSINLIRLKNRANPFKAGKDHLHHILLNKTKSVFSTNFIIMSINIVFFTIGYFSLSLISPLASLIVFISLFIIFYIFRNKYSLDNI